MLLSYICNQFIEYKRNRIRDSTLRRYRQHCNSILKAFGDRKFNSYTYKYFYKILLTTKQSELKKMNANIKVLKQINKFTHNFFNVRNRDIERLEKFKNIPITKSYNIWSIEEYEKFKSLFTENQINYEIYFDLLFYGGLRRGEAFVLQVKDLENNNIYITKSYDQKIKEITMTKTESGTRVITMPKTFINKVNKFIQKQQLTKNDFLFSFSYSNIVTVLYRNTKLAGLTKITPHDLRHSHASILFENNMPTSAISKRLGHSNISITLDVYTHLTKKSNDKLNSFILEL